MILRVGSLPSYPGHLKHTEAILVAKKKNICSPQTALFGGERGGGVYLVLSRVVVLKIRRIVVGVKPFEKDFDFDLSERRLAFWASGNYKLGELCTQQAPQNKLLLGE